MNRDVPAKIAEDLLHLGRQYLEQLPDPVLPLGADLVRLLEHPASPTALDQHQVVLLLLENSTVSNVEIPLELACQHPLLEVAW